MRASSTGRVMACVLAMAMAGCSGSMPVRAPAPPLPASFKEGGITWQQVRADAAPDDASPWWQAFGDPLLDTLVGRARRANAGLAQAEAAYRQAQASVRSARAAYWPSLGISAADTRGTSQTQRELRQAMGLPMDGAAAVTTSVQVQASASWEPDLWGRVRRQVQVQQANAQAAGADLAGQRLSLVGSVVQDYLGLRQMDVQIGLLASQVEAYRQLLDMTRSSHGAGSTSADDVLQARINLDAATVSLANARISRAQYEHALAVLCGQAPADFSLPPRPDYRFTTLQVPVTLPSQLLLRRPDIIAAEQRMAAANAQVGLARAAFFPSLDLQAGGGYSNGSWSGLLSLPNRIWSAGPQLALALFDGGARRAAVAQAQAGYDAAAAAYRQAVLSAFQDVEDALSSVANLQALDTAQQQSAMRQASLLAHREQARAIGTASVRDVLVERISALDSQRSASDASAQLAQATARLRLAVAGDLAPPARD